MFDQLLGIARNTFFESIRQPIVLVVLLIATIALVLSNPLSSFTNEDDQRMLVDMGMATVFLCGALLAAFVATGVLTREIDNKTALTVISKPVGRPIFVIGKFFGVASALAVCIVYMSAVFLLVEQHSVLETVRDPVHVPVILFGVGGLLLGVGISTWCNYFYGLNFASTTIITLTPIFVVAWGFSLLFTPDFRPQPIGTDFEPNLIKGMITLSMAIMVLTAIAVAASARLGQVMTLVVTLGVFLTGLLSDWLIGRPINALHEVWLDRARAAGLTEEVELVREFQLVNGDVQTSPIPEVIDVAQVPLASMAEGTEAISHGFLWIAYSILPNFQILWLSDALTQRRVIPMDYVVESLLYGVMYVVAALALAIVLFQRREVA